MGEEVKLDNLGSIPKHEILLSSLGKSNLGFKISRHFIFIAPPKELPDKRTSLWYNRIAFLFNKIMNRFHELHCKNRSRFSQSP
ncbi:hypothetical protein CEXT_418331 [Caerostris extrusa]|uniref:Uncharacterized protein n=1 Tax=Caerostris extrusa TaxID=172846 RepID=A0AAV4TCF4_CAEEX|nr:hypothetical protein CEXT_418331 [Caerostris extrusa]